MRNNIHIFSKNTVCAKEWGFLSDFCGSGQWMLWYVIKERVRWDYFTRGDFWQPNRKNSASNYLPPRTLAFPSGKMVRARQKQRRRKGPHVFPVLNSLPLPQPPLCCLTSSTPSTLFRVLPCLSLCCTVRCCIPLSGCPRLLLCCRSLFLCCRCLSSCCCILSSGYCI